MPKIQKPEITIPPKRTYSDSELKEFHEKIQKFWGDPRILENGETARKFYWEELGVNYGAFSRWNKRDRFNDNVKALEMVKDGHHFTYMAVAGPDGSGKRFHQFINLWDQYNWWLSGNDWKKDQAIQHQLTAYEQISEQQQGSLDEDW